ncbi:uncharacterized protein SCHCODRAFT_02663855 [Schizophyllum commune H4-8]|uniref:Uncharacterized protein n=1 Tax=Schizophyllum commune (strain H4-8 / FGSC 9210) TaxID=578458 RepID=D8PYI6_SCHCM|nr:uncharacterized protein SCHCODRAFT_02663855 [Schizophyllum commune H4-8]KAI5895980.1 hypothetical protein SCHCODRAFT_02663855 [Schizophyllum commune H4-8]
MTSRKTPGRRPRAPYYASYKKRSSPDAGSAAPASAAVNASSAEAQPCLLPPGVSWEEVLEKAAAEQEAKLFELFERAKYGGKSEPSSGKDEPSSSKSEPSSGKSEPSSSKST